jgi:hypothetical protein
MSRHVVLATVPGLLEDNGKKTNAMQESPYCIHALFFPTGFIYLLIFTFYRLTNLSHAMNYVAVVKEVEYRGIWNSE